MILVYILNEDTSYVYYSWNHFISSRNVLVMIVTKLQGLRNEEW